MKNEFYPNIPSLYGLSFRMPMQQSRINRCRQSLKDFCWMPPTVLTTKMVIVISSFRSCWTRLEKVVVSVFCSTFFKDAFKFRSWLSTRARCFSFLLPSFFNNFISLLRLDMSLRVASLKWVRTSALNNCTSEVHFKAKMSWRAFWTSTSPTNTGSWRSFSIVWKAARFSLSFNSNFGTCTPVSYTHLTLPTKRIV